MLKFNSVLIILFLSFECLCINENEDIFVPSTEWQEVKSGQKIPAGLHIRINLQTGKKEAKLSEETITKTQSLTLIDRQQNDNEDEISLNKIRINELKQTLKKIKNDDNPNWQEKEVKKFKSYEELKKDLDAINLIPKLDSEIIKDLIEDYKNHGKNNSRIKNILEDLEYLSHQIDNAVEFVSQNGFKIIVYTSLNNTNTEVKLMSLKLMSSLMQNNPKVQIHGLETGCVVELLKIITLDKNADVKYQAIGALSSVLRRFPLAQKRFLENGGLSVISKIFDEGNTKHNIRIVTLIVDLIIEHQLSKANKDSVETLKQYELINLEEKLVEHQWCENVNKLLHTIVTTDEENHDYIEKSLISMKVVEKYCITQYDKKILNYLYQKFTKLALEDIDKDEENSMSNYFSELKDLCDHLIIKLNKVTQKTEL